MYFNLLKDVGASLKNDLLQILNTKHGTLSNNRDKTNLVKYYCMLREYGKEIFNWEVETFEIVLGNKGFGYDEIMDMVGINYIISAADYVLTNKDHFENAVQIFNDMVINTANTEKMPPHDIMWTIICILVLFNSDNLPIIGSAATYIAESFKEFGWTQPPAFLLSTELRYSFDEIHPAYYDIIRKMNFQQFGQACLKISTPTNGFENYLKHHAPIIQYIDDRIKLTKSEIKQIIVKG